MATPYRKFAFSAGLLCLASGCATAPPATLEIKKINHPQLADADQDMIERGRQALRMGQNADAISAFRTALREESNAGEAYNGLAIAYDRIGRKDLARRYFEQAVAVQPGERRYEANLARFFETSGQPEMARGLTPPASIAMAAPDEAVAVAVPAEDDDPALEAIVAEFADAAARRARTPRALVRAALRTDAPKPAAGISAVAIDASLMPAPDRLPFERRIERVADLPRSPRRGGPRIERASLAEVRLVTLPYRGDAASEFEFGAIERRLAQWTDEERRMASYEGQEGIGGRRAVQAALQRASIEEALAGQTALAALMERMDSDFVYTAFDIDRDAELPGAA